MFFFIVSCVALFIISITMLARANDLRLKKGIVPVSRLLGFIVTGFTPIGVVGHEWITKDFPNFYETAFRFGLMLVFVTTPYLPPYWRFITGWYKGDIYWTDDRRAPPKKDV